MDLRVRGDRVEEIGVGLALTDARVVEGGGGGLLPGLHDHHLHLLAMGAALRSVACGPPEVGDLVGLGRALAGAGGRGWVRGNGYHESVAGVLDRGVLDALVPDRPVRIQHRSGALWMLNSRALQEVSGALDESADVERGADGVPNGRLWRYDARLRAALPDDPPDLGAVGARLAGYGITGVTDATPDLDDSAIALLSDAHRTGLVPQRITLLGAATGQPLEAGFGVGPRKILLRDHDLPGYDELAAAIVHSHREGRAIAVHCVTRESLLLTLAILQDVGSIPGDRIEHAGVVPADVTETMADLGIPVITQPGFLWHRGDDYARDVAPDDLPCLYPHATLLHAGIPVALSSDAPYGPTDPWTVMRAAVHRTTRTGRTLGPADRVPPATALAGYLSAPDSPGGEPRRLVPGTPADLCLLHVPLRQALHELDSHLVRSVMIAGRFVAEDLPATDTTTR
ncbi:amidohydrolase family protein [Nocardia macrotermitis]|uniref:amidohydrolase family protein n=1 Tax=Nocardia macrotermitis TaxID=2585198 RepID=UPI0029E823E6|nr:amidohydrolase family protein [Nocardia macrotermitis]